MSVNYHIDLVYFCVSKVFIKKLIFFIYFKLFFLVFLDHLVALISKVIFKK
jgi:hypothetical protein